MLPGFFSSGARTFLLITQAIIAPSFQYYPYFKNVYDELSKRFKLGRVRILLKEPRSTLSWHRDPEPRLHIPIYTNPGAIMVIDKSAQHMPADGLSLIHI